MHKYVNEARSLFQGGIAALPEGEPIFTWFLGSHVDFVDNTYMSCCQKLFLTHELIINQMNALEMYVINYEWSWAA